MGVGQVLVSGNEYQIDLRMHRLYLAAGINSPPDRDCSDHQIKTAKQPWSPERIVRKFVARNRSVTQMRYIGRAAV